jgi:hypothetical protein
MSKSIVYLSNSNSNLDSDTSYWIKYTRTPGAYPLSPRTFNRVFRTRIRRTQLQLLIAATPEQWLRAATHSKAATPQQ